ncbi:hypothetical protein [Botrimarina sp.]|uniref:hypothetical protein n=1 Tax=Botrimarina sp. TaxID=2795802 RepID=UPI0032EC5608
MAIRRTIAYATMMAFLVSLGAGFASAQPQSSLTASDRMLQNMRQRLAPPSVDRVITQNLNSTRSQAASDGVRNFQVQNTSVSSGTGAFRSGGVSTFGPTAISDSKPFTNITRPPTVSPYLRLFDTNLTGAASFDNYNTLVRPRLEQQAFNDNVSRQTYQLNQRVQQISARPDYNPQGSDQMMATGHTTTFGYYSHFYPRRRR